MVTIVTRAGKGSALTYAEADANFTNLNDGKQETLVSATNIKTINGSSVLGAGDLVVSSSVSDGDKGDITVTASGATWTIDAGVVTLSKMASLAASTILGNNTGIGATPIALTAAQVKTLLAISLTSDVTGTLQAAQMPAFTGDVTNSGLAMTIPAGTVTLAKQADVATGTVFYRKTAATGVPEVQTLATLKTDLGLTGTNTGDQTITLTGPVTGSGTGSFATTITAAAVTLAMQADVATARIMGRATAATGPQEALTAAQAKTVLAIANTDVSGLGALATQATVNLTTQATGTLQAAQIGALTGDVTSSAGSYATTIAANAVTLAKMAQVATATFLGRTTAATGNVEALTATQATAMLNNATTALKGLVPAPGTALGLFLKDDMTWAAAAGGGSTFMDSTFAVQNTADTTKQLKFDVSGVTTLSTRTMTVPDVSGTLVLTAATQTLTGKSIVATQLTGTLQAAQMPALTGDITTAGGALATTLATVNTNTGSWGLAGSVGQFTVNAKGLITAAANVAISIASTAISDLATAIVTIAGTQTITGAKTFSNTVNVTDSLFNILDDADPTKKAQFQASVISTATTRFYNLPNEDGTFVLNTFKNIAVAGQSTVVADNSADTLTLIAGSNITLTTNATTDEITITAAGGAAGSVSMVKAIVDFGAFPGASDTKLDITGLGSIVASSRVSVTLDATASADHSADEHWVENIELVAGNIVAATGFTIYARNAGVGDTRLHGKWNVVYSLAG